MNKLTKAVCCSPIDFVWLRLLSSDYICPRIELVWLRLSPYIYPEIELMWLRLLTYLTFVLELSVCSQDLHLLTACPGIDKCEPK